MAKEGQLQVWWIPQVPMEPFTVDVATVREGLKICDILADYDIFQFENNIKPDYCNTGGVQVYEGGDWTDLDVQICDGCLVEIAEDGGRLCPGCEAYQEHTA